MHWICYRDGLIHPHGAHPRVQVWTKHLIFQDGLLHPPGAHPRVQVWTKDLIFYIGILTHSGLILEFRFGLSIWYSRMDSFTRPGGLIQECRFGLHMGYLRLTAHLRVQAWPSHRTFRDLGTTHWIFREGLFHRPFRLWTPFFNLEFRLGLCCGSGLILNLRHVFCIRSVLLNLHRIYEQWTSVNAWHRHRHAIAGLR